MNALAESFSITNALSVDVEDYFQVQALSGVYERTNWDSCESRVERNTDLILNLLADAGAQATFFILGWIAERHGALVRRIVAAGHEVASHGYYHIRVDSQTPEAFRADIRKSKIIIEDASGTVVKGYRAATFSMGPRTPWAWAILEDEAYTYSSSVYPVIHDIYAFPEAPRTPYHPDGTRAFTEIPITTIRLAGRNWPCGGGGYFRLLPYAVSHAAITHINKTEQRPAVFYIHPWELDPDQPRPVRIPAKARLRHYLNLTKTRSRLALLAKDFRWSRIDTTFDLASAGIGSAAAG